MRIGILHNAYKHRGGEERVVESEAELLRTHSHDVRELTYDSREQFATLGKGLRSVRQIASGWNRDASKRIAQWVIDEQLDVVHVHNIFPMITGAGVQGIANVGVPIVMTLHNFRPLCATGTLTRNGELCDECVEGCCGAAVLRGCYRSSRVQSASWALATRRASKAGVWRESIDTFIAPSEHVRDTYIRAGFPAKRIVIRPHFTDMQPMRLHDASGAVVIGRIDNSKGILELIQNWDSDGPPLTVVGDGPDAARARTIANKNVSFTGRLEGDELARTIARAAVLVAPSRLPETFGLTLIESAACGVPAVAFAAGAAESIVQNGKTGVIVRSNEMRDLVRAAKGIAKSSILRHQMADAAFARYKSLYAPDAGYASLIQIYNRLVDVAGGRAA